MALVAAGAMVVWRQRAPLKQASLWVFSTLSLRETLEQQAKAPGMELDPSVAAAPAGDWKPRVSPHALERPPAGEAHPIGEVWPVPPLPSLYRAHLQRARPPFPMRTRGWPTDRRKPKGSCGCCDTDRVSREKPVTPTQISLNPSDPSRRP